MVGSAPADRSISTHAIWLWDAAVCNGVVPIASGSFNTESFLYFNAKLDNSVIFPSCANFLNVSPVPGGAELFSNFFGSSASASAKKSP